MTVKIAIAGAAGRMGQELIAEINRREGAIVSGTFDRASDADLDVNQAFSGADVVIDFTLPAATSHISAAAQAAGAAYVLGTTGHSVDQQAAIRATADHMAVLWAANFSLGVNVLLGLVERAAQALPADHFDLDIMEMHHSRKVDAPSGTALALGQAAAAGRGQRLDQVARYTREGGIGARPRGEIGFATLRGGDNPGEHTVLLLGEGERIELSHRALDRSIFAKGAVTAALWLKGRPPGLYSMADVLAPN